jgi:hypothetical protein
MESEDQDDRSDTAKSMDLAMFLIVGLFVGMGVAAFQLYRLVTRMSRKVVIDKSKLIDLGVDAEASDPDSKADDANEGRS